MQLLSLGVSRGIFLRRARVGHSLSSRGMTANVASEQSTHVSRGRRKHCARKTMRLFLANVEGRVH